MAQQNAAISAEKCASLPKQAQGPHVAGQHSHRERKSNEEFVTTVGAR
jgi:hypothetical protein